jgi:hypothetical protein
MLHRRALSPGQLACNLITPQTTNITSHHKNERMSEKVSALTVTFLPPKPVVILDWYHGEFHEFMEGVQLAVHLEGAYSGPDDDDEGEDRARREIYFVQRRLVRKRYSRTRRGT